MKFFFYVYFVFIFYLTTCATSKYNQILGKRLLYMSLAAYCSQETLKNWRCDPCGKTINLKQVKTVNSPDGESFVYLGYNEHLNTLFCIFRGFIEEGRLTASVRTQNQHKKYLPCLKLCKVQKSMYYSYLVIHQQFLQLLKYYKQTYSPKHIVIAGYSIGGALATHAVSHMFDTPFAATHLYTFGSPRVGDNPFAKWFNGKAQSMSVVVRVTHRGDPLPHQPWVGFFHFSGEIFYPGKITDRWVQCSDTNGEDANCSAKDRLGDFSDHLQYFDFNIRQIITACSSESMF